MSLFPRALYDSDSSSFTPLFRLLDDFDNYSRQGGASSLASNGRSGTAFWQPRFDIREHGNLYELHGEFPGMRKEDIYIEFPQPQTLVIRGKSERTYSDTAPSSSSNRVEDVSDKPTSTEADEGQKGDTVAHVPTKAIDEKPEHQPKYWLRERTVGEFSRTFTFPSPVDQDAISAGFKDGVLSVSVPKAKKPQPRRIAIN